MTNLKEKFVIINIYHWYYRKDGSYLAELLLEINQMIMYLQRAKLIQ